MPTAYLRPSGVGTYDFWSLGAGASKTAAVDPGNPPSPNDATYITIGLAPGANNRQSFFLNTGIPSGTILTVSNVNMISRARCEAEIGDPESYFHYMIRNGVLGDGSNPGASPPEEDFVPTTSFATNTTSSYPRPNSGTWVGSDFVAGNIEGGVVVNTDNGRVMDVSAIWAELLYTPVTGGYVVALFELLGPVFGAGLLLREVAEAARLVRASVLLSPAEVVEAWRELREHRYPAFSR
jgi:hypothetical protein